MNAAVEAGIPIVAIGTMVDAAKSCPILFTCDFVLFFGYVCVAVSGKGYDFAAASDLLLHLDTVLDLVNPGATDLLRSEGVEPVDAAYRYKCMTAFWFCCVLACWKQ